MRTRGSRTLYRYWRGIREGQRIPHRSAIEPRGLKEVLPWTFIVDRVDREMAPFRLAGTGLCEQYGRELRGSNFLSLWLGDCRRTVRSLIDNVVMMPAPAFIEFEAQASNERRMYGEIVLLPLAASDGEVLQILGGWFPAVTHDPLLERPLIRHRVKKISMLKDEEAENLRAPVVPTVTSPARLKLVISNGKVS